MKTKLNFWLRVICICIWQPITITKLLKRGFVFIDGKIEGIDGADELFVVYAYTTDDARIDRIRRFRSGQRSEYAFINYLWKYNNNWWGNYCCFDHHFETLTGKRIAERTIAEAIQKSERYSTLWLLPIMQKKGEF